jgi:hypothetical protein
MLGLSLHFLWFSEYRPYSEKGYLTLYSKMLIGLSVKKEGITFMKTVIVNVVFSLLVSTLKKQSGLRIEQSMFTHTHTKVTHKIADRKCRLNIFYNRQDVTYRKK